MVQVANYRNNEGEIVAQKRRSSSKEFTILGNAKEMGLYGAHLWKEGGRRIVVTEGEIDALSVATATGGTWPVVSLPNGAQAARKAIAKALPWLSSFETVVLCFDMDEPGREAAAECATLFEPGKCSIAELPRKDASDMLQAGDVKQLSQLLWQARVYRPGGVVNGADLWERITEKKQPGLPYPWPGLTAMTLGQKMGKLVTWTSGTGQGKSTAVAQVAYEAAFVHGLKVGYVALEEDVGRAALRFISHKIGKLAHIEDVPEAELKAAFNETMGTERVWFLDHFGSTDSDDLLSKLRYLAKGCGCQVIVLDHLSIVVSGMDLTGDERRTIDRTMTMLRTLVEETGCLLHLVSHLKRIGDDKGHEEGSRVSLAHLRGSQSIAQLSDMVIALERNQQAEDSEGKTTRVRVLKNRESGATGIAGYWDYDQATGKLVEVQQPSDNEFTDQSRRDVDF